MLAGCLGWPVAPAFADSSPAQRYQAAEVHMGTAIQIVVYAEDESTANKALAAAFAEIARLDSVMSDYRAESELSRLGAKSPTTEPVPVSDDLWKVLRRAQFFSRESEGAFDVTVGPLSKLWRRARRRNQLPAEDRLAEARRAVGYEALRLDEERQAVELRKADMRLDLGGIAKGYAADAALATLQRHGISRALVNAGGDMALGDPPPGEPGWPVGVAPRGKDGPPSRFLLLKNCGIATSGDAWQYVEVDGRRYSHIMDPRTGVGLTDRSGVTVVAPDGMTADALASTVSVLGHPEGIQLVDRLPGCAALVVRVVDGEPTLHASKRFAEIRQSEEGQQESKNTTKDTKSTK